MSAFDAAIIGGGIIGSSIAWELARSNMRVVVLDRQEPGREASWAAAGILSPAPESAEGFPMVPLGKASLALYPEFVAAIEEESGHRTGFRPKGTLQAFFAANAEQELSTLIALHHGLGLDRKSTRLNSSHANISYAVFCLKKKKNNQDACASTCRRSGTMPRQSQLYDR